MVVSVLENYREYMHVKFFFVEKSFPSTMVYAGPKAPDISQFLWDVLIKPSKSFSSLGQSKWILMQS
jgi:hypothetical protein